MPVSEATALTRIPSLRTFVTCPPVAPALADKTECSCRESLTVEALGWTEFSLCTVTLITTVLWMRTAASKSTYRDSRTFV